MSFPKRWVDDDGASTAVRDVLRSGRGMDPPEGAESAVWLALGAKIAAGAVVTAATAKTAAAATTKTAVTASAATGTVATGTTAAAVASGGLLKSILIGAFGGVIAVTGYSALEPSPPPSQSPQTAVVAPAPTKDRQEGAAPKGPQAAPNPGVDDSPAPANNRAAPSSSAAQPSTSATSSASEGASAEPAPTDASNTATPAPGSPEERASRLREESDMLNQARAALRGGDTAGTMRLLEQARQKFPGGALGQEREALAIEAIAKAGNRAEASSRAAAFIQAHPNSPHAARLQVFVQP